LIIKGIVLAFSSALLLVLSFPKFDIELLAWITLVPLFIAIRDKSLPYAFGLSFLTGISALMGIFYWINILDGLQWLHFVLLGIYFGSYFGLFGLLLNFIKKRGIFHPVIIAPIMWVSMEYIRSHVGFLALPWALLGHSQYLNLPVIQISSITGVYGVSFLIVMVNYALSEVILYLMSIKGSNASDIRLRPLNPAVVTILISGLTLAYGYISLSKEGSGDKVNIAVVQANIPQEIKWKLKFRKQNLEKHVSLTRKAVGNGDPALIVWPETSVAGFYKTILELARETGTHLIIGSSQRPKIGSKEFREKNLFNSAFLISPKPGIAGQYNKIRLLPFGEYLPHKDFPWPESISSHIDNYTPGTEHTVFNLNGNPFSVLICWENIFPGFFRQFVKKGAKFMVNITNEAWFKETAAPYQFLAMNVFRAVENRVSVVRSANTGISCFIDPYGRIIGKVKNNNKDIFVEGYLVKEIPLSGEKTFYTLFGDIFAYIITGAGLIVFAFALLKYKR
jgi:apolipoprotein N-acyltransferase